MINTVKQCKNEWQKNNTLWGHTFRRRNLLINICQRDISFHPNEFFHVEKYEIENFDIVLLATLVFFHS